MDPQQNSKSSKKPVSFEFIGPSRAIQKKLQITKKGVAIAAQEFPPKLDLEKLKEYRKKSGPAPKLFMPTDQDKEDVEKEVSQLAVLKTNNEQHFGVINENHDENGNASAIIPENSNLKTDDLDLNPEDMDLDEEFQGCQQQIGPQPEPQPQQKSRLKSRSRSRTRSYSR